MRFLNKDVDAKEEARLRSHGWMTTDEFLDKLLPGLREYLGRYTYLGSDNQLNHPEDMILNIQTYMEVGFHVIADFGVASEKPAPVKKKKKKTSSGVEQYSGSAYCIDCKENVDFEGFVRVSDSGRRMAQGICDECGTKVNRILGKAN
jgi:hypothetical protein